MVRYAENEVDGIALLYLTESDVTSMFPGKIGLARKVIVLLEKLKVVALSYNVQF